MSASEGAAGLREAARAVIADAVRRLERKAVPEMGQSTICDRADLRTVLDALAALHSPAEISAEVAVPVESLDPYDAGLLGDGGGGDVDWWQDYIRAELQRAHEFYSDQVAGGQA